METIDAILLGLLQGLTEFLPVSSSGHLVILGNILGTDVDDTSFAILVHAATVLATITVFWGEILRLVRGGLQFRMNPESKYLIKIVISMIPVMIVGLFFKDKVEALFGNGIRFVGCMLFVTAALLLLTHFIKPKKTRNISAKDAFIIGVAQAVAVIPGISRSGSTIATGMLLGDDKSQLAKFSFLMVLVPILGEAFGTMRTVSVTTTRMVSYTGTWTVLWCLRRVFSGEAAYDMPTVIVRTMNAAVLM